MDQKFGKSYKLCSRKIMDELFSTGKSISCYPFRLVYNEYELPTKKLFQVTISVPKRNFKKAPDRNRIKRLIRESLRKNKTELEPFLQAENKQMALFLIYVGKEILSYSEVERKIVLTLERLINDLKKQKEA